MKVDNRKVAEFLAWAFGIAWAGALAMRLLGIPYGTLPSLVLLVVIYMWAPAVAAAVVQRRRGGPMRPAVGLFRGRLPWLAIGWLTPVGLAAAAIGIGILLPGVALRADYAAYLLDAGLPPDQSAEALMALDRLPVPPPVFFIATGLLAGLTVNALAALGEELGWRGLLLTELSPLGFWKVSLLTGAAWGLWHAPIVLQGHNFPDAPAAGVFVMTLATLAMSPVYTYVTVRARSVLAATFLHGSFNGLGGLTAVHLAGAGNLVTASVGLVGIGAGLLATLACVAHDRWSASEPITTGAPLDPWQGTAPSGRSPEAGEVARP